MSLSQFLLVLVAVAVLDLGWAVYTKAVAQHRPARAGFSAVLIYLLGAMVVTQYVGNLWVLLPAAIGSFIGTYLGTWWGTPEEPRGPACPDAPAQVVCDVNDYAPIDPRDHSENAHIPWQEGPIKFRSRL